MRKLIKQILINEARAMKRHFPMPKPPKKINPKDKEWIHSLVHNNDGTVTIIWKEDVEKLESKIQEVERLKNRIEVFRKFHPRSLKLHHEIKLYQELLKNAERELQDLSIDKPIVKFFDDI